MNAMSYYFSVIGHFHTCSPCSSAQNQQKNHKIFQGTLNSENDSLYQLSPDWKEHLSIVLQQRRVVTIFVTLGMKGLLDRGWGVQRVCVSIFFDIIYECSLKKVQEPGESVLSTVLYSLWVKCVNGCQVRRRESGYKATPQQV